MGIKSNRVQLSASILHEATAYLTFTTLTPIGKTLGKTGGRLSAFWPNVNVLSDVRRKEENQYHTKNQII